MLVALMLFGASQGALNISFSALFNDESVSYTHLDVYKRQPDGRLPDTNFRNNGQGVWLGYNFDRHKIGLSLDRYKLSTQTWFDDPEGQFDDFSVKIPKLEREKIGLFYDYAADGDYLKNIHVDAYTQTIERKFENRVKTTQVIPSPMIKALTVSNQTNTNDKQYTLSLIHI